MADLRPDGEGGEGDRDGLSSVSASGTTEGIGSGAASPSLSGEEMEQGEPGSPEVRTRSGSFVSDGSNVEGMDYHEGSEGDTPALRLEDLQVQESAVEPHDGGNENDGDNREEIGSLDSSVQSRRDDGDLSQKADQVGDDHVSPPVTPATPTKKDKKEGQEKEEEGEEQRGRGAGRNRRGATGPRRE